MEFFTLLLLSFGLSMDAMCVSIANGAAIKELKMRHALKTAFFFGAFQALMPLIGYAAGSSVASYIEAFDHWIAFVLLSYIGAQMVLSALSKEEKCAPSDPTSTPQLLTLAVATSIDALAVGVTLAFVNADIFVSAASIGIITFTVSFFAVFLGRFLGALFRKRAEIIGGATLIFIGLKILLEHLHIL